MTRNLLGMHDPGGVSHLATSPGWLVISEALGCDPNDRSGVDYRPLSNAGLGVIVRLNHAHNGVDGTIPTPDRYADFARRCAHFVAASPGCTRWIIGNEPNHAVERPDGQPILPLDYADCYGQCRAAIRAVPGHERDEVCVAPVAPWDATCTYPGNPHGDWLQYMAEVLVVLMDTGCDALAIHSYVHGSDPALIHSTAKMNWPFEDRYFNFLAYQDTLGAVPKALRHLPVYLTEFDNCDGPWTDVNDGLIQSMVMEVDSWNRTPGVQQIHCAICYRWAGDQWALQGKQQRLADFAAALALGIASPLGGSGEPEEGSGEPEEGSGEPEPLFWDPRLDARGTVLVRAQARPGQKVHRVVEGRWFNKEQAGGRVNTFVDVQDEVGNRAVGTRLHWGWSGTTTTQVAENKTDPWLTAQGIDGCAADFGMKHTAPTYWTAPEGLSDRVEGLGLGDLERPGMKIHTSYYFRWQVVTEPTPDPSPGPEPPDPSPPIPLPEFAPLIWPVKGPVSQRWGENPAFYQQALTIPYHNGVDIATPAGTDVVAAAAGVVKMVDMDEKGYGWYCRIYCPAQNVHVVTAHLSAVVVVIGQSVQRGELIGYSGNTGLSSGPHTHVECRLATKDGGYAQGTFGHGKGRVDPQAAYVLLGGTQEPALG